MGVKYKQALNATKAFVFEDQSIDVQILRQRAILRGQNGRLVDIPIPTHHEDVATPALQAILYRPGDCVTMDKMGDRPDTHIGSKGRRPLQSGLRIWTHSVIRSDDVCQVEFTPGLSGQGRGEANKRILHCRIFESHQDSDS